MRKLKLFTLLTALCCSMMLWAADEGPWTRIDYKTGQTGLNESTSSTFNGLNGNHWAHIGAWNDDDGIGYVIDQGSSVAYTKTGVFSIYERQESLPSYTRKVLTWTYQVGSCCKKIFSNTALYGYNGSSNDIKNITVDFTHNYSNGAGSGYLAERFYNTTLDDQGHFTNSKTWNLEFDNRNGTSQVTKYWSLLLTHVVAAGNNLSDLHEWGSFKSISESWATYYYKYVSFNANGGSGSMSTQTIENSGTLTANAFTRTGYTFDGWATSPTGGKAYNNQGTITATSPDKGPVPLYARWTANTYKVKFNGNGSTSGLMNDQNFTYDAAQNLTANAFSKTGYTFAGWATSADGDKAYDNQQSVNNLTATNSGTVNLYAVWTANTYKVKFNGNGSTSGSMDDQNFTYDAAQNLTANAFSKTGYTFAGWATSADGDKAYDNQQSVNNLTATNGGTFNLYAKWTVNQYTITFNNYDGTQLQSSQVNYGATPAYAGATPTKPSTAAYTYTFNGWSPAIATVTGDATYTAQFTEQINQATVDAAIALINAIDNPVVYTTACHDKITGARTAYEALTAEQKALVDATTLQVLTDAETAYAALEADHNAANAVIELINAIDNPVVYTDACHQKILAARAAYNNLTQAQKDLIDASTLQKLTDAEAAYAALNVDTTPNVDPVNPGVYYSTFYDGSRKLQLPANVEAYVAALSGDALTLTKIAEAGQVIPANNAVILKSTESSFTLTPSEAEAVTFSATNSLQGTDVAITTPANCYILSGTNTEGVGFYPYSGTNLNPHKAYVIYEAPNPQSPAPRRMRFIFDAATGVENVQGDNVQSTKVLRDGQLIIIRNGVEYNANGMMVK